MAIWVSDPSGPDWDGPSVVNVLARPGGAEQAREAVREWWLGHLCVDERDMPTEAELQDIQMRLHDVLEQPVLMAHADTRRGVVVATVIVADEASQQAVDDAFGAGMVELHGALTPID